MNGIQHKRKSEDGLDVKPQEDTLASIHFKRKGNEFSEYYVDFSLYKLKNIRKLETTQFFPSFKDLRNSEKSLKIEESSLVSEFILVCFLDNRKFVADRKLYRMSAKIKDVLHRTDIFEFYINYFYAIDLQKKEFILFNFRLLEIVEIWINKNMGSMIENSKNSILFKILLILFSLLCTLKIQSSHYFSSKFMKNLTLNQEWQKYELWESLTEFLLESLEWDENCFIADYFKTDTKKAKLKEKGQILELILQVFVVLLKQSMSIGLDLVNHINDKYKLTSIENLKKKSFEFESKWIENKKANYYSFSEKAIKIISSSFKTEKVMKMSFDFLRNDRSVFNVIYVNKSLYSYLKSSVLKLMLLNDSLDDEIRFKIWLELAKLNEKNENESSTKSKLQQANPKTLSIISLDVRRTNFAKFYSKELESLLVEIAVLFPSLNYYQGMNCIGGFLLIYLNDYSKAISVFKLLVKKRLSQYFTRNFESVPKLIYICSRVVKTFLPKLFTYLENISIDSGLYISPFFFTVFTTLLQYFQNYNLIAKIFDMFISLGWIGFFQVLVFILGQAEEKLIKRNFENILIFLNKDIYEFMFYMNCKHMKVECEKIRIRKSMIIQFSLDFDRSRSVLEQYWNDLDKRSRQETGSSVNGRTFFGFFEENLNDF